MPDTNSTFGIVADFQWQPAQVWLFATVWKTILFAQLWRLMRPTPRGSDLADQDYYLRTAHSGPIDRLSTAWFHNWL